MSVSLSFRWYRVKALTFFWVFNKVRNLYFKLDTYAFKKYRLSPAVFSKETLKLAHTVAAASCKDSGICAVKSWKPSTIVDTELEQMAWKAKQETSKDDIDAYNAMMAKIQTIRELTPEENERALAAIEAINNPDGRGF